MKLIDKSALVAEIDKLKGKVSDSSSYCNGWQHALRMLELSLDTLEVKEIDLKEKHELTWEDVGWITNLVILKCKDESTLTAKEICEDVLKQFKAQKGG